MGSLPFEAAVEGSTRATRAVKAWHLVWKGGDFEILSSQRRRQLKGWGSGFEAYRDRTVYWPSVHRRVGRVA
jgi:hypothetical protein